jgi:hypothetical protein
MKTFIRLALIVLCTAPALAFAQEIKKDLRFFSEVIVSPKINLILERGERESIRIVYAQVDPEKINIEQEGDRLKLYLDDARLVDKREYRDDAYDSKASIYRDAEITAYVTYTELELLEVRGAQEVTCRTPIQANDFVLRVYGETEIMLDTLNTERFKLVAYGENKIRIRGKAERQRYTLYGENKVDGRGLAGATITTNIYGEGRLQVNASDEVKINAFGEPRIDVEGTSMINKGLILGKSEIRH